MNKNIDINDVHPFICYNHNDIISLCEQLKLNMTNLTLDEILKHIDLIYDRAKCAKRQGIKMENRLKKYRTAIQRLGFVRED